MSQASDLEQYLLELINADRARAGAQALVFDDDLNAAAEDHSRWMIATDTFSHTGAGASTAGQRMTSAGYVFSGTWTWGENIAWATTRSPGGLQDEVELLHANLMNSPGHRANLLNDSFREIGLGFEIGEYAGRETAFLTEDFARSGSAVLLTGVAFGDRDGDRRYDPGEGLAGLAVTAESDSGARHETLTAGAGGYELAVPAGSYRVTFAGSGIAATTLTADVGGRNVKLDLVDPARSGVSSGAITGTDGNDRLLGSAAAERFNGRGGDDLIDGGPGNDTAVYAGLRSEYGLRWTDGAVSVSSGREGNDRVLNVEQLQFADGVAHVTSRPLEYIASYADLSNGFGPDAARGFDHYTNAGFAEGRSVTFSGLEYIASYSDLIAWLGVDAAAGAAHFIANGRGEGRSVTFDALEYIASYPDLIAVFGADGDAGAAHFIANGRTEGRSVTFDALEYIASYPDLIAGLGANAERGGLHFVQAGFREGRHVSFDPVQYLANYADLSAAFGGDVHAATLHYISHGYAEGRTDAT
jgi:serralysin